MRRSQSTLSGPYDKAGHPCEKGKPALNFSARSEAGADTHRYRTPTIELIGLRIAEDGGPVPELRTGGAADIRVLGVAQQVIAFEEDRPEPAEILERRRVGGSLWARGARELAPMFRELDMRRALGEVRALYSHN